MEEDEAGTEPVQSELEADAVASATFPTVRKGYDPGAVEQFLAGVAVELRRAEADSQAARLETKRLRRQLEDALAEMVSSEPDTNEAITALGDEAGRVIQAAQQSSQEIVVAAEAAAEEIRARAREEAHRIAEEARRDAEDFDGRLTGQADEVRARLRDEIRKARADVAAETDRIRAQARDDAAAVLATARDEAADIRGDAEESAHARREQAGVLSDERVAEADSVAQLRIAQAEAAAEAMLAEAEAARGVVLAELQGQRERLESHVRELQTAQAQARADIGAAQTMFAALLAELGRVRLRDVEIPALDLDLSLPFVPLPIVAEDGIEVVEDVVLEAEIEVSGDEVPDDEVPDDETLDEELGEVSVDIEVEAGEDEIVLGEQSEDDEIVLGAEVVVEEDQVEEASLEWDDAETPGDAEIEALFDRVVSQRGRAEDIEAIESTAAATVVSDEDVAADDDRGWGYADDLAREDTPTVLVVAPEETDAEDFDLGDVDDEEPSRQERVLAALHRLAVDTGERPVVTATAPTNGDSGAAAGIDIDVDLTEHAIEAEAELEFDRQPAAEPDPASAAAVEEPFVAELVPPMTRKVKRALQEVENAAMDVDRVSGDARIDVLALFSEYLVGPVADVMALGYGSDVGIRDFSADAEVVLRSVCGQWADELSAGIASSDPVGAPSVVRAARRGADSVAQDLALTAYTAGRDRAARSRASI